MFDKILKVTLGFEGGYSNHPGDPGGETNHGITRTLARMCGYDGDMKEIPMDVVVGIYRKEFWERIKGDELLAEKCPHAALNIFDFSVTSGPGVTSIIVQLTINSLFDRNLKIDGVIGSKTLSAISETISFDEWGFIACYCMNRKDYYRSLDNPAFEKGWVNRVNKIRDIRL